MKLKKADCFLDPGLVLYLPLHWLDGDSFVSKDKHGHLCTVSGAVWTSRGRSFDGVDDRITGPVLPFDTYSGVTVLAWGARTSGGRRFVVSAGYAPWQFQVGLAGTDRLSIELNIDGTYYHLAADGATPLIQSAGDFYQMGFTHSLSGGRWVFYVNGLPYTSGIQAGSAYAGSNTIRVGTHVGLTGFWGGLLGAVSIYNRAQTAQEIQQNYLETKWRYR